MNTQQTDLNPNAMEKYLKKASVEFTKQDIIDYIKDNEIEMVKFRSPAGDGRLKTLNFVINNLEYLDSILTTGERVDGSSLMDFIEAGSSDLYVVPKYSTAFLDPFEKIPTLSLICSYFDNEGNPLKSSPEYILHSAHQQFKKETGYVFKALGELEYYIYDYKDEEEQFKATDQRGYHESVPFAKFEHIRTEAMLLIAKCGGKVKYGHNEVGSFTDSKYYYEQQEIEFLPCEAESAVEQLLIAKWILRNLCAEYGVNISFAPKITEGKAGSGLHIHMMLEKDGRNAMLNNEKLSDDAKKMIAGILDLADSLTSFGNTIPTSYLRLVPHQEAPTNICWGDRNRSVLVRVPLGWTGNLNMIKIANPQEPTTYQYTNSKQTVEIRSGDGSADLYLYMASIIVAAEHGLTMPNALEMAEKLYVGVNIFSAENEHILKEKNLNALPDCCFASAEALENKRKYFEKNNIFPSGVINNTIRKLKAYNDIDLRNKKDEIQKLVTKYIDIM